MVSKSEPVRWGILGTGFIARKFADGLRSVPDCQLRAVGSRSPGAAKDFASAFGVPAHHGSYAELLADPGIDVVYIATPHPFHRDNCIESLKAGKAVLCEKPFTVNAGEAREIIDLARERRLFCMEAMWMRFMPLIAKVKETIDRGEIGEIRLLTADFGYPVPFDPKNRLFDPALAGGALLDRGVYPLSLAYFLLGSPARVSGEAYLGASGVDEGVGVVLNYPGGAIALLWASLNTYASNSATITGTKGKIVIHEPFYQPEKISVVKFPTPAPAATGATAYVSPSGLKQRLTGAIKRNPIAKGLISKLRYPTTTITAVNEGNGLNYEAAEVVRCLRAGKLESPLMSLDDSLKIMETMDQLRGRWQLKYPQDQP